MLSYGKPVMGLPLCQTELDEGVRYLDVLDHLQKMQAVGLFFRTQSFWRNGRTVFISCSVLEKVGMVTNLNILTLS